MALKDKLMTLEDFKAVRDVDVASNSAQFTEIKADLDTKGLSNDAKVALLNCFSHVAYIDAQGQSYYNSLESALYPDTGLVRISAVFTQGNAVVYPTTPLDELKAYLVVTGHYRNGTTRTISDYSLSGTLITGTSTVTVSKEGKTTTFNVTVSAPYWDYEWYSSSRTFPEGMTATEYDFTTENGVLYAKNPNLDFEYTGNCKFFVEMKVYNSHIAGDVFYRGNNPQITVLNAVVSENAKRGAKFVFNTSLGTSGEYGMVSTNVNGANTLVANSNANQYHTYEITAENNTYTFRIDGEQVSVTQNSNTTQYITKTGIDAVGTDYNINAFIKSIKFKRL